MTAEDKSRSCRREKAVPLVTSWATRQSAATAAALAIFAITFAVASALAALATRALALCLHCRLFRFLLLVHVYSPFQDSFPKFSTTPLPLPAPRQLAIPQTTPPLLPHREPLLQPRRVQLRPLILDLPQRRQQPPQPRPLHSRHRIINPSPILPRLQYPRRPQRPQMSRQIRLLHLQRIRQLAHTRLPFEQRDRQPQSRLIRQRLHQLHRRLHNEYMSICSYINRACQTVKQNFLSHSQAGAS